MNLDRLNVLVPNEFGSLSVCDLAQLAYNMGDADDDADLDEIVANSSFDSTFGIGFRADQAERIIKRVRKLNETGDAAAYWDEEKS